MPRLSLWRENFSNDYKYIDRNISEQFTVGGTGVLVHKYLGTKTDPTSNNAEIPNYPSQSAQNIQDLLFLENRDRKYDTSVYSMRGIYQVSDSDFDLTQFGLFLQTGTVFMTFHINDMVATLGRRIMSGDVLELMHLKDYEALNDLPVALKRFFIVGDCSKSSEGFSPTWWPHLWRCKISPLVDSQEYKDILNLVETTTDAAGNTVPVGSLSTLLSTYNKYSNINDAVIAQAEADLPMSGYDTTVIYVKPLTLNTQGNIGDPLGLSADNISTIDASLTTISSDKSIVSPDQKVKGYLAGDGLAPNGLPVASGIAFPPNPIAGDYCLRVDYLPNRLFRYDGNRWTKVEDAVRTNLTPGASDNQTQRSKFVNNTRTHTNSGGNQVPNLQGLSNALKPQADNL